MHLLLAGYFGQAMVVIGGEEEGMDSCVNFLATDRVDRALISCDAKGCGRFAKSKLHPLV